MKTKLTLLTILAAANYGLPNVAADGDHVRTILKIVFGIAGALAMLFLVLAGLKYITSAGNPQEMSKAKNGILYAVAGLAACLLAEALVTFVIGHV